MLKILSTKQQRQNQLVLFIVKFIVIAGFYSKNI